MISVKKHSQGAIWANTVSVDADEANLVVLRFDTQQKRCEVDVDVTGQGSVTVVLSADENTLAVRDGADREASTVFHISGLTRSKLWRTATNRGRYTSEVIVFRPKPRRQHRQIILDAENR